MEFIGENGGGPGVRLRKRQQKKGWVENGIIDGLAGCPGVTSIVLCQQEGGADAL